MKYQGVVIHHSASEDTDHADHHLIREWHIQRGFVDIGYHWVVESIWPGGKKKQYEAAMGRPMYREGAHAKGYNSRYIGVCLVGNFSKEEPNLEQLGVAAELTAGLLYCIYGDNPYIHAASVLERNDYLLFHGDLPGAATECPGKLFPKSEFRQMVADLLRG